MIRNIPHVVIDMGLIFEMLRHHPSQDQVQMGTRLCIGLGVMLFPYHHRHTAGLAFGDPAHVIFEKPLGQASSLAQLASLLHDDSDSKGFEIDSRRHHDPVDDMDRSVGGFHIRNE